MGGVIGVFDSGVGGLTVLRALRERLPSVSTVYLGDTARVPYGTRSPEVVVRYSRNTARFLLSQEIELLVVACNTATAHALPTLQAELPVPVIGVVEPGAAAAARVSPTGRIGVIGTAGTIASGAYQKALARHLPSADVVARACPLLVPLAEEGWTEGEVPRAVARRYLDDLRGQIDTLVLGCTHYPLLQGVIGEVLGPEVRLIDSARATAEAVAEALGMSDGRGGPGGHALGHGAHGVGSVASTGAGTGEAQTTHRTFVTDLPANFSTIFERFLGARPESIEQIDI